MTYYFGLSVIHCSPGHYLKGRARTREGAAMRDRGVAAVSSSYRGSEHADDMPDMSDV